MAAPKENLLSLGHRTITERNTLTKQREHSLKKSRAIYLQQRWQELKERELRAQQHNRQLLQQFEEAQGSLRQMLTLTAAMKTIRIEYERYLEESYPRWQQQLKEKTQAAQKKRMEENLRSCLKNTEERVTDPPLLSQGPTTMTQKIAAPQKHYSQNSHLDHNQDGSPHLPYMQSSWLMHPQAQTARFPITSPYQPQGSSHAPPSFLPPPIFSHPLQLHHLASTPGQHHLWLRQNPAGQTSPQPDYPWSWTVGAAGIPSGSETLWGHPYMEEPPPERGVVQVVGDVGETGRALSSKRERGSGSRSSHLSQELDIQPVRLSSHPAESSESSRESSQTSREKRKKREKRGRSHRTSSDRERCSSQESSRTASAIVPAAVTVAQSSESDASSTSTSRRRRRSVGLAVESPRAEKVVKERTRSNRGSPKEESQPTAAEHRSEEAGEQSPEDKSDSCKEESGSQGEEESGSVSIKIENGGGEQIEKEESSSSEESSAGEKDEEEEDEEDLGEGDEEDNKEDSQRDDKQEERDVEDDDEGSDGKHTREEEEETEAEEEMQEQESEEGEGDQEVKSDGLKNEIGKQGSASSQDEEVDEDESEGGEDKMEDGQSDEEEEGGGEEEEEQSRDKAEEPEEESDSEDSIISPQNKSKKLHIIPEEAGEDEDEEEEEEEGSKTGSSDDNSNDFSDEDIEHLLAPQEQSQKKEEKDPRADEKPKVICDKVERFQVETDRSTKMDQQSDSEEFDHFYD